MKYKGKETVWLWRVTLEGQEPVEVVGINKYHATMHAAFVWGVEWKHNAAMMDVLQLRRATAANVDDWARRRDKLNREREKRNVR